MTMFRRGFVVFTLLAGLAGPALAQRTVVGAALLQFEEQVTWEAVSREWRGQRPGWQANLQAAVTPAELSRLLVALETTITWEAVQRSWRGRREGWLAEAGAARSEPAVARLLLELEEVTLWSAVAPAWRDIRPGWVDQLAAVAGQTPRGGK